MGSILDEKDDPKLDPVIYCQMSDYKGNPCPLCATEVVSDKRVCSEHARPGKGQMVITIQGKKYFAVIVPFESFEEPWIEYKLKDETGRVLRVRHIVKRIVRIEGLLSDDGVDTYTFQSDLVSDVQPEPPSEAGFAIRNLKKQLLEG